MVGKGHWLDGLCCTFCFVLVCVKPAARVNVSTVFRCGFVTTTMMMLFAMCHLRRKVESE
jgi:hypothetical protein